MVVFGEGTGDLESGSSVEKMIGGGGGGGGGVLRALFVLNYKDMVQRQFLPDWMQKSETRLTAFSI